MLSLRALSALLPLLARHVAADRFLNDRAGVEDFAYGKVPNQTFVSANINAPLIQVNEWKEADIDRHGYLLFTVGTADGHGPVIYRADDLSLVYANLTSAHAYDASVQRYRGQDYLTFWEGGKPDVHSGACWLFDSTYQLRHTVQAQNLSRDADMHECKLTADGTALITVYEVRDYDTSAVGGNATDRIIDGTFQEIDVATGAAVFTWRASDHFGLDDSLVPYAEDRPGKPGYDFAHINSVEKVGGNYLLSFRHLCTVALVGPDGTPLWRLGGGRHNDFEDLSGGNATNFCYQHDARFAAHSTRELTLYDNHRLATDVDCAAHCSRGLRLALDPEARTVRVAREYWHPRSVTNIAMGGYQALPDSGNVLLAWGMTPSITEHAADGSTVMDLQLGPFRDWVAAPSIYRAKKLDWLGRPRWNPSIAGVNNGSAKGVYLSWNGATEVAQWAVMAANSTDDLAGSLRSLANATRSGFETYVELETDLPWVRAAALSSNNTVLAATDAISLHSGTAEPMDSGIDQVSGLSAAGPSDQEDQDHDSDDDSSDEDSGDSDSAAAAHALARGCIIPTMLLITSFLA